VFSIVDGKINQLSFDKKEICIPAVIKIGVMGHRVLKNEPQLIDSVND